MLEKRFSQIPPQAIVADGTINGKITVTDTRLFKVKQKITLQSNSQQPRDGLEIKRIINSTEMIIGPEKSPIHIYSDMSDFLVADTATVAASEQFRPIIPQEEISRAVYEEEPTVALRTMPVDKMGNDFREDNPLYVSAAIPGVISSNVNFIKNGATQTVTEDTSDSTNNIPLPVKLTGIDGDVSINAENLNLETQTEGIYNLSTNPNPDNVGLILHSRSTNISDANQVLRQTGKIGTINANTISADVSLHDSDGNSYTSENPLPIEGSVSISDMPTVVVESINGDAFGRTRVSELFTLGDYMHDYGPDGDLTTRLLNGASVSYPQNKACARLTTNNNPMSYATHQTKAYHHYQPGKSQLILSSICFGYAERNITKRTGYFDDRDGIYFEQVGSNISNATDNGQLNFVIRSFTDGVPSESQVNSYMRRVPQNLWNKDKCDGTGLSGFNINTSKTVLVYMDFQWLGVGRVRCGFVHDGKIVIAHEYYHSNILNTVYITNPNLPVRCEIFNTGTTDGGSMDQICSSVCSEGGYIENGSDWSVISGLRTTLAPGGTKLPLIAIRLKNSINGYPNRSSVRLNSIGFYAESNSVSYSICKIPNSSYLSTNLNNGVLTWISANANSSVEYCVNATSCSLTAAEIFANGFIPAGSSQNSLSFSAQGGLTSAKKNLISQNIDSTDSEIYVILIETISTSNNATANASAAIQWRETF